MSEEFPPEVLELYRKLHEEAEAAGYHLNPDRDFALILVDGLYRNRQRYGYMLCPCRMGEGEREKDLDIICPCDYRDADLVEYGQCYCALYVTQEVLEGKREIGGQIPERRPDPEELERRRKAAREAPAASSGTRLPVWRCRVCGYLAAREK
ncbi:MAG: ferredoxin-thioredoxin reductase catalytic domain-containing protein, partial [Actinomycetota bacterium]